MRLRAGPLLPLAVALSCYLGGEGEDTEGSGPGTTQADGPATDDGDVDADGSDDDPESSGGVAACEPTEDSIRATIFEPTCAVAACHDAETSAGGLDLTIDDLGGSLAGRPSGTCDGKVLIEAGDPDASFLHEKLGADPTCGAEMPIGGMLTADQVGCIDAWIGQLQTTCETCGTGSCVDVTSAIAHCGGCDQPCPGGVPCVDGACQCPGGTVACAGSCVDTQSSPTHCGGCDQPCGGSEVCLTGTCSSDCGALTNCGGACVDLDANPVNCGDCGVACGIGETCNTGMCECEATPLSYAADIEPILTSHCTGMGCHSPMGPIPGAEGLNLAQGAGYASIVNVSSVQCADRMRVEPGSPSTSYLYDKVLGVDLCFGTKMPKVGAGLSNAQLQSISDWICSGAAP